MSKEKSFKIKPYDEKLSENLATKIIQILMKNIAYVPDEEELEKIRKDIIELGDRKIVLFDDYKEDINRVLKVNIMKKISLKSFIIGFIVAMLLGISFLAFVKLNVCPKIYYQNIIFQNKSIDVGYDKIEDFKNFCEFLGCKPIMVGCGWWSCICES